MDLSFIKKNLEMSVSNVNTYVFETKDIYSPFLFSTKDISVNRFDLKVYIHLILITLPKRFFLTKICDFQRELLRENRRCKRKGNRFVLIFYFVKHGFKFLYRFI